MRDNVIDDNSFFFKSFCVIFQSGKKATEILKVLNSLISCKKRKMTWSRNIVRFVFMYVEDYRFNILSPTIQKLLKRLTNSSFVYTPLFYHVLIFLFFNMLQVSRLSFFLSMFYKNLVYFLNCNKKGLKLSSLKNKFCYVFTIEINNRYETWRVLLYNISISYIYTCM